MGLESQFGVFVIASAICAVGFAVAVIQLIDSQRGLSSIGHGDSSDQVMDLYLFIHFMRGGMCACVHACLHARTQVHEANRMSEGEMLRSLLERASHQDKVLQQQDKVLQQILQTTAVKNLSKLPPVSDVGRVELFDGEAL